MRNRFRSWVTMLVLLLGGCTVKHDIPATHPDSSIVAQPPVSPPEAPTTAPDSSLNHPVIVEGYLVHGVFEGAYKVTLSPMKNQAGTLVDVVPNPRGEWSTEAKAGKYRVCALTSPNISTCVEGVTVPVF